MNTTTTITTNVFHSFKELSGIIKPPTRPLHPAKKWNNIKFTPVHHPSAEYWKMIAERKKQEYTLKVNRQKRNEFPDWEVQRYGKRWEGEDTINHLLTLWNRIINADIPTRCYLKHAPSNSNTHIIKERVPRKILKRDEKNIA